MNDYLMGVEPRGPLCPNCDATATIDQRGHVTLHEQDCLTMAGRNPEDVPIVGIVADITLSKIEGQADDE